MRLVGWKVVRRRWRAVCVSSHFIQPGVVLGTLVMLCADYRSHTKHTNVEHIPKKLWLCDPFPFGGVRHGCFGRLRADVLRAL